MQSNNVGVLWFGVSVDATQSPGLYKGTISLSATLNSTVKQQVELSVELTVQDSKTAIPNAGADDLWRMARLAWLNSDLGIDRNTTSDGDKRLQPVTYTVCMYIVDYRTSVCMHVCMYVYSLQLASRSLASDGDCDCHAVKDSTLDQ